MRVVLVILCVALANGDEPPKIADSAVAASEENQWAPFFGEGSRASEGLPWGSIAPELDGQPEPRPDSQSSGRQETYSDVQPASSGRQETYPNPQSATSSRQETYPNPQSANSGRQETYTNPQSATSGRQETYPNPQSATSSRQETYPNPQSATSGRQETYPNQHYSDRGETTLTKDRKDVHKVTITKKVRVPYKVHVEKHIPKIIEVPVDKPFNVYVPKPYPVIVEKKVPYEIKVPQPQPYTVEKRVPYPVKVLVDKPYTLHVPKPYPVDVEKKYEFTVEKKIPYEVKVPVERPYPVHVIVEKEVKFPVEKKVPVPVKVPYEKPIPIHVTKHVPVNVDKPVPYTVEKVTTYPVKVPFRIPIKVHYPEGGSAEEAHGDVQNFEWAEAMNSATRAAKLESRPAQWYGGSQVSHIQGESQRQQWQSELQGQVESQKPSQWHGESQMLYYQGESHTPQWQSELQKQSQGQGESQKPSQWHAESQRPPQYHADLQRPSLYRPNHIRQGFSAGRGPTRNVYLLSQHVHKGPTTKLQPVGHHYEVKEAQFEKYPTAPFLNRPGSEVVVPQMVLADSPPSSSELQQSNSPHSGLQQSNSVSSSLQQSNPLSSSQQHSNPQNLPQSNFLSSGFQTKSPANGNSQQGPIPLGFSNSNSGGGFSSPNLSNQHTSFVEHQSIKNGTPSFSIMNVIHHSGTPRQQSVIHHRAPYVLPSNPSRPTHLQYLTHNSLGSNPGQLPSSTFFKPAHNTSTHGTQSAKTQDSVQTPFGTSGFTISFRSPPWAEQQATPPPSQQRPQLSQQQPQLSQQQPQLFKPITGSQPPQSDQTSSSYFGSTKAGGGQQLPTFLTYSTSIHHSQISPPRPEQT